ncbi:FkbM family methyltransferase [Rhodobacteraceae bacterium D3-12]|nr:FkbM family methyltransferase [Rhodobacteraceae bacterium D3-12]
MSPSLYERIEVWNERRIEKVRLRRKPLPTADGFLYKGMKSQYRSDWEPLTRQLVRAYSEINTSFVNVGSHYGYYACMAAHLGMRVTAFEPIDANYQMLRDNLEMNNLLDACRIIHGAVGDHSHITKIYGAFSGATLLPNKSRKPSSMFQITQVFTLSEIHFDQEPTLFLMDVEGFELNVLNGAKDLLSDSENNSWIVETGGDNLVEFGTRMIDAGYSIFHIGTDKLAPLTKADLTASELGENFLCTNLAQPKNKELVSRFL